MIKKIKLIKVQYIPGQLEEGTLYLSEEYKVAVHLCPCGCGNKVVTPLGPTDWSFKEVDGQPSLYPSIGNWQIPCRSHYFIINGIIEWSYQWTKEEIETGRKIEDLQRTQYYNDLPHFQKKQHLIIRIFNRLMRIFKNRTNQRKKG